MPDRAPFSASVDGFAFTNSWPHEPDVTIPTPLGTIRIGDAAAGLCGGMVFAALDYWYAEQVPPTAQPAAGTPLYDFLVKRIVDSWHVPTGVLQYFTWMALPEGDSGFSAFGRHVTVEQGLSARTILQQWPLVKASIDTGVPAALGLVTVASHDPSDLGKNHQVLAYAYQLAGTSVTLNIYDPNSGQDDGVTIAFDTSAPHQATAFTSDVNIPESIRGFFLTAYSPATPPS